MNIDLSKFKVVYDDRVLNAISILRMDIDEAMREQIIIKPKFIDVLVLNEDGNVMIIRDETWRFQFIPVIVNDNKVNIKEK